MLLSPVFELSILGVADRDKPNQERVILRPTEAVNLGMFGLIAGYRARDNSIVPLPDRFFWFGNLEVRPPSWIIVYTGKGEYKETDIPGLDQRAYVFHWGRVYTLFSLPEVVPAVIRIDGISAGGPVVKVDQKELEP